MRFKKHCVRRCSVITQTMFATNPASPPSLLYEKATTDKKAQVTRVSCAFCYYILCFCRWTKSLNLTAAFRRFLGKTGLEITTYRFCSIGYYNFIIIFKREQVYRCSHREFFHINIDKYSALYLASKASALLLYLFIYLLYNNRAINSNLTKAVSNFQEVLLMKTEESIVTHDLLRIVSV